MMMVMTKDNYDIDCDDVFSREASCSWSGNVFRFDKVAARSTTWHAMPIGGSLQGCCILQFSPCVFHCRLAMFTHRLGRAKPYCMRKCRRWNWDRLTQNRPPALPPCIGAKFFLLLFFEWYNSQKNRAPWNSGGPSVLYWQSTEQTPAERLPQRVECVEQLCLALCDHFFDFWLFDHPGARLCYCHLWLWGCSRPAFNRLKSDSLCASAVVHGKASFQKTFSGHLLGIRHTYQQPTSCSILTPIIHDWSL